MSTETEPPILERIAALSSRVSSSSKDHPKFHFIDWNGVHYSCQSPYGGRVPYVRIDLIGPELAALREHIEMLEKDFALRSDLKLAHQEVATLCAERDEILNNALRMFGGCGGHANMTFDEFTEKVAGSCVICLRAEKEELEAQNAMFITELAALRAQLDEKDELIEKWQSAAGLVDSGGDPSEITPDEAAANVERLYRESDRLKSLTERVMNLVPSEAAITCVGPVQYVSAYIRILLGQLDEARKGLYAYQEAVTPSADTKAAFMGEFSIDNPDYSSPRDVPWTTIKEIMKAIQTRALAKIDALNRREG